MRRAGRQNNRTGESMKRYPEDYNPIREYWEQIESGKVTVSQKVYKTYRHVIKLLNADNSAYFYDPKRANHVIEFIENFCHHSKGKAGGKLVVLELWEKAMLAVIFGFVDIEGNRMIREAALIIGKKNGKSLIASCVGCYLQTADNEAGPEVVSIATKRDQAKIIWAEAKRMVKKSPALSRHVRTLVAEMVSDFNDGVFKPLGSDSDTLDGLNIHGALMDEIHQWKSGRALFDIIADGVTAREQPLVFITSTAGTVREDIYDEKYDEYTRIINGYDDPDGYHDEHTIAFIYELDARAEWVDPKCWQKANPGLGTIKNVKTLADKVEKAKHNPALVRNLVCKEFNIPETSSEAWLNFEDLDNRETFDVTELKPRYGIGGADLASTTDLCAAKVIFRVPNDPKLYVMSMYWLAEDLLEKRVREDHIPYDIWHDRGLLRLCPGNAVHPKYVTEWFVEVQEQLDIYIPWIGYDRWSAKYWVEEMAGYFGADAMVDVAQGKQTLSEPMKRLGNDLTAKLVNYNNNPIDKWCLTNTAYDEDKNGNIQPHKTSRPTKRIDGTAALLDAYTVYLQKQDIYMGMI